MNNERYVYTQDQRDRKRMSAGARHKKNGSKSKKCTLPSDYMTRKEKNKMNGSVVNYTMNERHTWEEVKLWPEDLQKEYMQKLAAMRMSIREMAQVLQASTKTVAAVLQGFGIPRKKGRLYRTPDEIKAVIEFIGEPVIEPEPEVVEPEPEPEAVKPEPKKVVNELIISLTGSLEEIVSRLALLPVWDEDRHLIVHIN